MADELKSSLHESISLESEFKESVLKPVFEECMNWPTRHVFFASITRRQNFNPVGIRKHKKSFSPKLRYPSTEFPGIMIDNSLTGSLCNEVQLEVYRSLTRNLTLIRPLKNHFAVSAHGGSTCIGITTFKF